MECISPERLGTEPDVFGKLPHATFLLPFGWQKKKDSITSVPLTIMILCGMPPRLAVGEINSGRDLPNEVSIKSDRGNFSTDP